jgi:HD-like signal output (HDOD) protein/CheY-like chemotaxis protein
MSLKKILFVDDNENVINGIRRQLRPFRDEWELYFADNGVTALELMQNHAIDLIVSDMVMPGMRGDTLLKQVSKLHPATVRMILSGYSDEENLRSGLEVAHQYMSKPCTAEMLREVISQVFKIQACVNNPRIIASIGDINSLPSLPKIYNELTRAIADENTTMQKISSIFTRDMVLSAKLLQLINSPYFGLNRKISDINEAVNLIGVKKLSSLVLSVHVRNAFSVTNPQLDRYMEFLWLNAAKVSDLALLIAQAEELSDDRPQQAYLGGLLHNLGLLIFLSQGGDKMTALLQQIKTTDTPVSELESTIFGFTRCEAAAYVLSLWKIPPRIIESILLQKNPQDTEYEGVNALTAVHVAACLLQPSEDQGYGRLFEIQLNASYLERIHKLNKLPQWQVLADKVINIYANK